MSDVSERHHARASIVQVCPLVRSGRDHSIKSRPFNQVKTSYSATTFSFFHLPIAFPFIIHSSCIPIPIHFFSNFHHGKTKQQSQKATKSKSQSRFGIVRIKIWSDRCEERKTWRHSSATIPIHWHQQQQQQQQPTSFSNNNNSEINESLQHNMDYR